VPDHVGGPPGAPDEAEARNALDALVRRATIDAPGYPLGYTADPVGNIEADFWEQAEFVFDPTSDEFSFMCQVHA
jgi:hypothetical protein